MVYAVAIEETEELDTYAFQSVGWRVPRRVATLDPTEDGRTNDMPMHIRMTDIALDGYSWRRKRVILVKMHREMQRCIVFRREYETGPCEVHDVQRDVGVRFLLKLGDVTQEPPPGCQSSRRLVRPLRDHAGSETCGFVSCVNVTTELLGVGGRSSGPLSAHNADEKQDVFGIKASP